MKYITRGNFPCLCNGFQSYVIVDFICSTKEAAEKIMKQKAITHKNLQILELKDSDDILKI